MASDSEVCPGELVTLRCVLYSPAQQLLWICPEGGANGERPVLCTSRNIRNLECDQGTFSVSVLPCSDNDDFIISDATYNATTEVGSLTCAAADSGVHVNSSLQFGAHGKYLICRSSYICVYVYLAYLSIRHKLLCNMP